MKWIKTKNTTARYSLLLQRVERKINRHLQSIAERLQQKSDKLSTQQKRGCFISFCIAVIIICTSIIINAFK